MPSADLVIRGPSSLSTSSNPRPRRWLCPAASVRDLEYADEHRHDARQRRRHAAPGRIKIWVDGSPWIGNIDLSFPYLDTDATRIIGVPPGSCGHANLHARAAGRDRRRVFLEGLADGVPRSGRRRRRHDPRRLRRSAAALASRQSPTAPRTRISTYGRRFWRVDRFTAQISEVTTSTPSAISNCGT
jgi:hypothetical protein